MEESWNFFEDILPPEVTMLIFSHFSVEDVVYVSLVCKTWNTYFDTKHIWKQIFELNFGEVGEKSVDLTQNLRWKRLFFKASNAAAWKKDFEKASAAFRCYYFYYQGSRTSFDGLSANGRYHVVIANGLFIVTDIKMAAKIIPMKHNPVSLHSPASLNFNPQENNNFKRSVDQFHDTKAPKDNIFAMKNTSFGYSNFRFTNGKGDFAFSIAGGLLFFNIESHALNPAKNMTALYMRDVPCGNVPTSFNSKFLARIRCYHPYYSASIVDLSKKCRHCCKVYRKDDRFVPETNDCNDSDSCAIIEELEGQFKQVYASQLNPNKIILFDFKNNLVIWTYGEGMQDIKFKNTGNASYMSEQVVELNGVKRHWFTFTSDATYFVDLSNTHDRIVMPAVTKAQWIPKKSKIALVSDSKLTVYDLERNSWCSRFNVGEPISTFLFNNTGTVLFVATSTHIHAYLWEAALLLASLPHEIPEPIVRIHFALDQVLVISTQGKSFYKKVKTKLDI